MVHTCGSSYFAGRHNSNFFLRSDGLIAKGYGTLAWVMFIVYVIPILTLGIYKISKAKKN